MRTRSLTGKSSRNGLQNAARPPDEYLSLDQGKTLVHLARLAVNTCLEKNEIIKAPEDAPQALKERSGVFVTLTSLKPAHQLRGCIGFPHPEEQLATATIKAAIYAATEDPRFPPVTGDEFKGNVLVEVTVLTPPRLLEVQSPKQLPSVVEIGRHGLIVERGGNSGLLLPQVATEWNWDASEFLTNCCLKAGLPPDSWLVDGTKVSVFEGEIYQEIQPAGEIRRRAIGES